MKKINRNRFFTYLSTSFAGIILFGNFNFAGLKKKSIEDSPVKISPNPLSISRNKSGENNVRA